MSMRLQRASSYFSRGAFHSPFDTAQLAPPLARSVPILLVLLLLVRQAVENRPRHNLPLVVQNATLRPRTRSETMRLGGARNETKPEKETEAWGCRDDKNRARRRGGGAGVPPLRRKKQGTRSRQVASRMATSRRHSPSVSLPLDEPTTATDRKCQRRATREFGGD